MREARNGWAERGRHKWYISVNCALARRLRRMKLSYNSPPPGHVSWIVPNMKPRWLSKRSTCNVCSQVADSYLDRRHHHHQMMASLASNSFTQRRSGLQRAVWMGISLAIILFIAAASSASTQRTPRSVHRRALATYKFIFSYNSQHININDWISLFTLCLAPLIAHLVAGVPKPGTLS
jgi:hypothetical protein